MVWRRRCPRTATTPLFSPPPENRVLIPRKMAELEPAQNPPVPLIPQLLAKDGALAAWMIGQLRAMGYTEVNLNLGCPSGTVTAKGKGAGSCAARIHWTVFCTKCLRGPGGRSRSRPG